MLSPFATWAVSRAFSVSFLFISARCLNVVRVASSISRVESAKAEFNFAFWAVRDAISVSFLFSSV